MSDHSSVGSEAELSFLPMQPADLDEVLKIESVSHIHPWTKGWSLGILHSTSSRSSSEGFLFRPIHSVGLLHPISSGR